MTSRVGGAVLALATLGCGAAPASTAQPFGPVFQSVTTASGASQISARSAPTASPSRGVNTVRLSISDSTGAPVDGLAVEAVPFMPDMGHGASVKPTTVAQGDGVYDLTEVALPMAGYWTLKLTLHGAKDDTAQLSFQVP